MFKNMSVFLVHEGKPCYGDVNVRILYILYINIYEKMRSPFLNTNEFIYVGNNQKK